MKFWNQKDNDIFIYGDIASQNYFDSDVTAKQFADDLNACKGNVTIHINSNGGDCFTALAISNLIKQHKNFVTVSIEGICASAATLIACAGHKVLMASNALMMIHLPSVFLYDSFDAPELAKLQNSLEKVKGSIIEVYKNRTGLEVSDLEKMVEAETWLTAKEAKELNFIDEITGEVEEKIDDAKKVLILNSVTLKQNYYSKAAAKMERLKDGKMESEEGKLKTETLMDKITNLLTRKNDGERIENLQKMKTENPAVNAIIDVAIKEGAKAEEIFAYVEAVSNVEISDSIGEKILALIEDNLTSGAASVGASFDVDDKKAKADLIASFANKMER